MLDRLTPARYLRSLAQLFEGSDNRREQSDGIINRRLWAARSVSSVMLLRAIPTSERAASGSATKSCKRGD